MTTPNTSPSAIIRSIRLDGDHQRACAFNAKLNWTSLLKAWVKRVSTAPIGSYVDKTLGGRVERRKSGWFIRDVYNTPWHKVTEFDAAVSLAAYNFVHIRNMRHVLPIP